MGYQESWLYVQPQWCFRKLILAYKKTNLSGYYRFMGAEPASVLILKQPFGNIPKGAKILWVCGDRCFHNMIGVFNGHLTIHPKVRFIPVEQVLDLQDHRLNGINLNSRKPSENEYIKRYSVKDYAERIWMVPER